MKIEVGTVVSLVFMKWDNNYYVLFRLRYTSSGDIMVIFLQIM